MIGFAKSVGGPGSLGFLLLAAAAVGLWRLVVPRQRIAARAVLVGLGLTYLFLAVPSVALHIADQLPHVAAPDQLRIDEIKTLVVLGGDNDVGRIAEGVRVWRAARPPQIWLLNARFMVDDFVMAGAPRASIRVDDSASNTFQQVVRVATNLTPQSPRPIGIIASRLQMGRIRAFARRVGLLAILVPSPLDTVPVTRGWRSAWPTLSALHISRDALYEHMALLYYQARGWNGS